MGADEVIFAKFLPPSGNAKNYAVIMNTLLRKATERTPGEYSPTAFRKSPDK